MILLYLKLLDDLAEFVKNFQIKEETLKNFDSDTVNHVFANANYDLTKKCYDLIIEEGFSSKYLLKGREAED